MKTSLEKKKQTYALDLFGENVIYLFKKYRFFLGD